MMANDRETTAASRERKASEAAKEHREELSTARAARAESEAVAEAAEAAEDMAETATDAVSRMMHEQQEQVGEALTMTARTSEEVAHRASERLSVMLQTSALLANGYQKIWQEWLACSRDAMQKNVDGLNTLMRARTFEEAFAAQADLMKCELETLLSSSVKLSELSAEVANDAVHKMSEYAASQAEPGAHQAPGGRGYRGRHAAAEEHRQRARRS